MAKKRKLGRGLDALLGSGLAGVQSVNQKQSSDTAEKMSNEQNAINPTAADSGLIELPVEFIQPGKYQPRRDMHPEALEELAASIKNQGLMQPIVVRPINAQAGQSFEDARYEIIAGERRWRASQQAGLEAIPVIIKDVPDEAAIAMALIENIQREDLNPIEEAFALHRLKEEFELTHQEVADAVGKSRATVTNLLRLMGLTDDVQKMLEHGDLEMGHARALLSLPENEQKSAAQEVSGKGLSVRQAEALVRHMLQQQSKAKDSDQGETKVDPDIRNLQDTLAEKIGVPVMVQHSAKGKGKLILKYNSLDELDGILSHIH